VNKITKSQKIAVLHGGLSSEKNISELTGNVVYGALNKMGYNVVKVKVDRNLPFRLKELNIEIAFNALHGRMGEDGIVQGLLELMDIPYTGSGITSSAVAMDKVLTKHLLTSAGILTPQFLVVEEPISYSRFIEKSGINLPYIVKPAGEGSSIGISRVSTSEDLSDALEKAFGYDSRVLIEKFIEGVDITVAIYNNSVLGSMGIGSERKFLDYEVKYTEGLETFYIPPRLHQDIISVTEEAALNAHILLGCSFYSRIDFRITPGGRPYLLEVNTLPGLTSLSYVPKIAESKGINYEKLIEGILQSACLKGKLNE